MIVQHAKIKFTKAEKDSLWMGWQWLLFIRINIDHPDIVCDHRQQKSQTENKNYISILIFSTRKFVVCLGFFVCFFVWLVGCCCCFVVVVFCRKCIRVNRRSNKTGYDVNGSQLTEIIKVCASDKFVIENIVQSLATVASIRTGVMANVKFGERIIERKWRKEWTHVKTNRRKFARSLVLFSQQQKTQKRRSFLSFQVGSQLCSRLCIYVWNDV